MGVVARMVQLCHMRRLGPEERGCFRHVGGGARPFVPGRQPTRVPMVARGARFAGEPVLRNHGALPDEE